MAAPTHLGPRSFATHLAVAGLVALVLGVIGSQGTSAQARGPKDASSTGKHSPEHPLVAVARADKTWPGPARPHKDALQSQATCVTCHADVAREWSHSQHSTAFTDAAFQDAFRRETLPFCRGCHAPESPTSLGIKVDALSQIGVACVSCHGDGDSVLAAPQIIGGSLASSELAAAPSDAVPSHGVRREAAFAGVQACAGCHEFLFPNGNVIGEPDLMQSTISEHAASQYADRPCADCHMPVVTRDNGRRGKDHRFLGSRDEAFVRSAVSIAARRPDAATLVLDVEPLVVGHSFPTGDLFRRIAVEFDDGSGRSRRLIALSRHFDERPVGPGVLARKQVGDDRIPSQQATVSMTFAIPDTLQKSAVHWRVRYERVDHPRGKDPLRAAVIGHVDLASGILPAPKLPSTPPSTTPR